MISEKSFGALPSGEQVSLFTLTNANGAMVNITNYGGRVTQILLPTKEGLRDVVLGYDELNGYLYDDAYLGAIVGRYANRIDKGRFSLNGNDYILSQNNGSNNLHGGPIGFEKALWKSRIIEHNGSPALELTHLSPDGDQGFPGNLRVTVIYQWTDKNELNIEYKAISDKPTIVNLTNHSYFNLDGHECGEILNHKLKLDAAYFTKVDKNLIPKKKTQETANSPFDFKRFQRIGARINDKNRQLKQGGGYDHNFIINDYDGSLRQVAEVQSGDEIITMHVLTTEPGIQFYSGNFLNVMNGKNDVHYGRRSAFCLETQHFPDSPNRPDFPSTILSPGEVYQSQTIYRFEF